MKRCLAIASTFFVVSSVLQAALPKGQAAPAPDFWYVVPRDAPPLTANSDKQVRGIVIPSAVHPTVRTTPSGSVLSWRGPDGTRQSFAIAGMSSFEFEPGPIEGTTYVPFFAGIIYQQPPRSCCTCASWENSEESPEALTCVPGCIGCGCEGCICGTGPECSRILEVGWTLVAHNDPKSVMTFGEAGDGGVLTVGDHVDSSTRFQGKRLFTSLGAEGEIVISNPESIRLPGAVEARAVVLGDKALYAWSSPDAIVILEQPKSVARPSFRDGTVDLKGRADDARDTAVKRPEISPVMDRCSVCGTHPDSDGDTDRMVCVPGFSVCYRCISWECSSPGE